MTDSQPDRARLLHSLVEEQARRTPDAPAVTCGDSGLTYAELDDAADRLAQRLVRLGVRPETRVAVVAQRSLETPVSLLATLKAGGAYAPIDPGNPPQRFRHMLSDADADVVMAPHAFGSVVPDGPWVRLEVDLSDLAEEPASDGPAAPDEQSAAYVIYTSGSTGLPKGVVVAHASIHDATLAHAALGRQWPKCFLLLVSFSFDACAVGLYWTLAGGGHVVIPTPEEHADPRQLRALIERHGATHLDCTPALYSLILGDDASGLETLRRAMVGGETCPAELVERHYRNLPEADLVNNYGPTETTVWATSGRVPPAAADGHVPIGQTAPQARAYLLDDGLRPVADGSAGEFYIGGDRVARGYHGRPGATAERFLPDPWSADGGRMYRTGDRVRALPDGSYEFVGRVDEQVKVRGHRVELGEVEHALLDQPEVREAVADVRSQGDSAVLVAWYRPHGDTAPAPGALKERLAQALPPAMIPDRLVAVDELPRNVAGKVDRASLELLIEDTESPAAHGRTELEAEVAEIVGEILGVPGLRADQNLLEAGATSLHIARLALAVWSRFEVGVPIHQLFELPSIAAIAQIITAARLQRLEEDYETWDAERLDREAQLDDAIRPDGLEPADYESPRDILLTGATGYLGAFLLRELADRTDSVIWCLVRADSAEHGMRRVQETLERYLIWDDSLRERIRAVPGDLAQPQLGLSDQAFSELGETIDVIHHCGALVNFVYPYSELKPANVGGTHEILRLATTGRLKSVHYISSIDLFLQADMPRPFLEDQELEPLDMLTGYPLSKWVAEHLVRIARERGVPCAIYRPGMMMSHSETGATHTVDYLLIQIKGLLEFGIVPEGDFMFDAITIDYASKAIAHASLKPDSLGKNFHLWNLDPVSAQQLFSWVSSFGYEFEMTSLEEAIQHLVTIDPSNPLFPLLPLLLDEKGRKPPEAFHPEIVARTDFELECRNTLDAIADSDIVCHPPSEELAHQCFAYLVDQGFFPGPADQRARLNERAQKV